MVEAKVFLFTIQHKFVMKVCTGLYDFNTNLLQNIPDLPLQLLHILFRLDINLNYGQVHKLINNK